MSLIASLTIDRAALEAEKDRVAREILRAGANAIRETTKSLERGLEQLTQAKVPGRLWRAWTSKAYPRSGAAREPVGTIFLKGGARTKGAIQFFSEPGRIKNRDGFFLAIPLPAAGSRGRLRDLTPGEWERRTGIRLRFVYRRGKPALLVADAARLSGKKQVARASRSKTGRGEATVPIFVLLPFVQHENRFAIKPVVEAAGKDLEEAFLKRVAAIRTSPK